LAADKRIVIGGSLAFSGGGFKARIVNILSFKKPARPAIIVSVLFAVLLSVGLAANRAEGEPGESITNLPYESSGTVAEGLTAPFAAAGENGDDVLLEREGGADVLLEREGGAKFPVDFDDTADIQDNTGQAYDDAEAFGTEQPQPLSASGDLTDQEYIVESGDTLMRIAARFYGSGNERFYTLIKERNGLLADRIPVGQILIIPPMPANEDGTSSYNGDSDDEPIRAAMTNVNVVESAMNLILFLPADTEFGDSVRVTLEATPSDTGIMIRILNRSVRKEDFPKYYVISMPETGSAEVKLYYDGELMQMGVFSDGKYDGDLMRIGIFNDD
jgi:LysM repeat protein